MVFVSFRPESNFLDLDFGLRFTGFAFFFRSFVNKLAKIHNPADGWVSIRGYFYQVQVCFDGNIPGFFNRYDTDVVTVRADQANLAGANGFINSIV